MRTLVLLSGGLCLALCSIVLAEPPGRNGGGTKIQQLWDKIHALKADSTGVAARYKAASESERQAIRKELEMLVERQFDLHILRRREEVREARARLDDMRRKIEKTEAEISDRAKLKPDVVRVQVERYITDACGLTW